MRRLIVLVTLRGAAHATTPGQKGRIRVQAQKRSWLRRLILVACTSTLLILPGSSAFAQAETFTMVVHNQTEILTQELFCVGPAEVTITYNGHLHMTETANGTHITGMETGTVVVDPLDPSLPTYTGRFTTRFGENDYPNTFNSTSTFSLRAQAEDGSSLTVYFVGHITAETIDFSTDPPTVIGLRVGFDNLRCA